MNASGASVTVHGSALRYRDPSLLNSSSFDAFPPELRESLIPVATNLYDTNVSLKQTLFSFKLGHAIKAAKLGLAKAIDMMTKMRIEEKKDKKDEKKGGHVLVYGDEKKDKKDEKKGGHMDTFGDEKKDEKKGMGGK